MTAPVDIFISYKREERALAQDVGRVLQEAGYTTVTDLNIKKSKDFGVAIDEMIRQVRLVVVLWTPASTASDWVQMEALEANTLGKYFGVVMKPLAREDLPFEVRRKQYLDLGNRDQRELSLIVKDVGSLLGKSASVASEASRVSREINEDFSMFQIVERLGIAEGYRSYLEENPNGLFAERAREMEKLLGTAMPKTAETEEANMTYGAPLRNEFPYEALPPSYKCVARFRTELHLQGDALEQSESSSLRQAGANVDGVVFHQINNDICLPTTLRSLSLQGPTFSDLSVISFLTQLNALRLRNTRVDNLLAVTALPQLRHLSMKGNELVENIDGFECLRELRTLSMKGTWVKSLHPLIDLPRLHFLQAPNGQIAGNHIIDNQVTRQAVRDLIDRYLPRFE